jgi:hypothetical protein
MEAEFIKGYEAAYNEINATLNVAVSNMYEQDNARGILEALNMVIARVHTMKINIDMLKNQI